MSESALEVALSTRDSEASDVLAMLTNAVCQHCGRHPFALPSDRPGYAPRARTAALVPRDWSAPLDPNDLDRVDDDEAWQWQLVSDGDQTRDAAPPAPTAEEIALARRALAAANTALRRVEAQVGAVEVALSRPSSWLRPSQRVALASALRRGRAAMIAASTTRDQAAAAYAEMDRMGAQRRSYLATHRALLESATEARRELDRRVDDVIDAYAKSSEPPAWFRFGLGYPPRAETYADWLSHARAAIAYRRRNRIDHPLEPTGGATIE